MRSWQALSNDVIRTAEGLAQRCAIEARFIRSDIHLAHEVLSERFDIVYTSLGVLCWIPNVNRWAHVVARFLKPGGTFYIREYHPLAWMLNLKQCPPTICFPYFQTEQPSVRLLDGSIWNHGLAETVQALINAGLRIEALEEETRFEVKRPTHDWPILPQDEAGWHTLQDDWPRFPLTYTIRATLPASYQETSNN